MSNGLRQENSPPLKILVVDDDLTNIKLLQIPLHRAGHTVLTANSGEQAVALYQSEKPDAVLLDVMMPGISGLETAQRIRALDNQDWVPIIYLSALNDRDDIVRGLEAGGDDYLPKPVDLVLLLAKINALQRIATLKTHLREANQRLALNEEHLIEARNAAESAARMKSEFLANMSHEIRTPLNAILGLAQVGQRTATEGPSRRLFDRMLDSGQVLLGIIDDILDFSKIEANMLTIDRHPVGTRQLIKHVLNVAALRAEEKHLTLRVERADGVPDWFEGDFLRLTQVLGNLLSNAVKFTSHGEVVLSLSTDAGSLILQVRDTGIGMTADQVERLFTPFVQADNSTTRRFGGTGLGLAICKRLVELMDGRIAIASTPGSGTAFRVALPLLACAAPATEQRASPPPCKAVPLAGMRVLAAEDNPVNQAVLYDMLIPEGAMLECVGDGMEALKRIEETGEEAWDIVLADIQMPNMDGHQLAARLRELYPSLPVVGLTAHAFAEERQRCLDNGMVEHVSKPVNLDVLVATLRKHARHGDAATVVPAPAAPDLPEDAAALVDWVSMASHFDDRAEFVDRLAEIALGSQGDAPAQLRAAIGQRDFPRIARIAHSLKGMGGNFIAPRLYDAAQLAEAAARAGQEQACAAAGDLAALAEEFIAALRERVDKSSGNQAAPGHLT